MSSNANTATAYSRRKSCRACVVSKRRCDLRAPACTRCVTRKINCQYIPSQGATVRSDSSGTNTCGVAVSSTTSAGDVPTSIKKWIGPANQGQTEYVSDFHLYGDYGDVMSRMPMDPYLVTPHRLRVRRDGIEFCMRHFKSCLTTFTQQGQISFLNPILYGEDGLPPVLQDAYASCASYVTKNEQTEGVVFQILSAKMAGLVRSTSAKNSYAENLATVQAFILLSLMKLFDGDIKQRAEAEASLDLLESWTWSLQQWREVDISAEFEATPFLRWLFLESVRRTVIMSILLRAIYYSIKSGFCDYVPTLSVLPMSKHGNLWEAKGEGEWMEATLGFQPALVSYAEFVSIVDNEYVPYGLEALQRVLFTVCKGTELAESKFGTARLV